MLAPELKNDSALRCQACGSLEIRIKFKKNNYDILECRHCSFKFIPLIHSDEAVNAIYSDAYFFDGGVGYPNYLKQKETLINHGKWYANLISKYRPVGSVLDSGAAAGFILKGFVDSGWLGTGIEPNQSMAKYGIENLNLDIRIGTWENCEIFEKVDLVNLIQVIGHFYDLTKTIEKIKLILKPGGIVLIESWNADSNYARLMGFNWHEYSPPSVLRWFSDKSLKHLFEDNGFKLLANGYPPKKISLSHGLSLLNEKTMRFPLKKQIFKLLEKLVGKVTIAYPLRDVKWYLFEFGMNVTKTIS
jgi:SAM-dependent methyltransferase